MSENPGEIINSWPKESKEVALRVVRQSDDLGEIIDRLRIGTVYATEVADVGEHAVAEQDVQAPADFVDEIVHVALVTAVVVAEEGDAALVVEEEPVREVDRLD